MSDEQSFSITDFGASFKGFLDQVNANAPVMEPFFAKRLREHFGSDPTVLPTLVESFQTSDHANVQIALNALLADEGSSFELLGMLSEHPMYSGLNFAQLIADGRSGPVLQQGPVEY